MGRRVQRGSAVQPGLMPCRPPAHPLSYPDPAQPAAGYDQSGQTFVESSSQPQVRGRAGQGSAEHAGSATPTLSPPLPACCSVQPSDSAASGFYVTNPNNRLTNNAASGGYSGARRRRRRC